MPANSRGIGLIAAALLAASAASAQQPVTVGAKNFTEGYVLAEIMAKLLESRGIAVERQFGFGGTMIAFEALRAGEVDVYAEYTGTVSQAILGRNEDLSIDELSAELAPLGLELLPPLGFNNAYAIAVTSGSADALSLENISDLREHAELRFGLSHEFRDRADGWPALKAVYALPQESSGIEHGLAYQALVEGEIGVTDAYTTDGDLQRHGLVVLNDDLQFFPDYLAMPMARADLDPTAKAILSELAGRLDDDSMRALNAQVLVGGLTFAEVATGFLLDRELISNNTTGAAGLWPTLANNTLVHLKLTGIALLAACAAGLSLALVVYPSRPLSAVVLYVAGLLQTIPSIALLALMIPLVGVGQTPAIIALFLYSLLPITRNSITALVTIDPLLRRVSTALGLTHAQQLRLIFLPLALPHVLAGIRIAAVVSIGTATLAAFIGAGGLGEPIVTGLALNDAGLILQGAIPAAVLALATELVFEALERSLVPAHLISARPTG
ncbi:MAG TPA: glycine betaine ABC transporter substrate-binding protein [Gammaproteobacteria bacterium]